jgi:hypothetical protein
MSSDYEYSDDDGDYYDEDEDELMDENDQGKCDLTTPPTQMHGSLLSSRFCPFRRGDGH